MKDLALGVGGLVAGLLIGYAVWGGSSPVPKSVDSTATASHTTDEKAAPEAADAKATVPSPTSDGTEAQATAQLRREVTRLQKDKKDLEARLAKAHKATKQAAATAREAKGEAELPKNAKDFNAVFDKLLAKGLGSIRSEDFTTLAKALKAAGPAGIAFLKGIIDSESDATSRFLAAALMDKVGDPAAIPVLSKMLGGDSDMLVRRQSAVALAGFGDESALGALRTAMTDDKDWGVRINSAYSVAKLGGKDGLAVLEKAYFDPDTPSEYLLAVLGGLADVADPASAPTFRRILTDTEDAGYLLIAMKAVAKMKDEGSTSALKAILASKLPESVRIAAQETLEAIAAAP